MPNATNEEREKRMAEIYHGDTGLRDDQGVAITKTGDEIIAGEDNRKDFFDLDDEVEAEALQKQLADSTVILTSKSSLTEQADGTFRLSVGPFRRQALPPCDGERFGSQHTGGWCSGFVIGSDVIVTAGYCGETEAEIQETAYLFGFRVTGADDPGTTIFTRDQVYFGKELIAHDLSPTGDFAVVRVDRVITAPGVNPLPVRNCGSIGLGANVGVIGYPNAPKRTGHSAMPWKPASLRMLRRYTLRHFIVRNSWGAVWGDQGFAYASNAYAQDAFTEAYGATMGSKEAHNMSADLWFTKLSPHYDKTFGSGWRKSDPEFWSDFKEIF